MSRRLARQALLPFFIPLRGCTYRCIYCDQRAISGEIVAPSPAAVAAAAAAYDGDQPAQLAFYGGSFTALPWPEQEAYLAAAQPALAQGRISGIRVSTRPDAVDEQVLADLRAYGVKVVELGIQSLMPPVLQAAGREYSPAQALAACELVKQQGLQLGIQLMTGLPGDDRAGALATLWRLLPLRPDFLRLYPTLVLEHTPLAALWRAGQYQPQSLEPAAELAGDMLLLAAQAGIQVIRLGLNPSASLEAALLAGPYHPAFGQLAQSAGKRRQALALLADAGQPARLYYPAGERSTLYGQHNATWANLQMRYPELTAAAARLEPGALLLEDSAGRRQFQRQADFAAAYSRLLAHEAGQKI